MANYVDGIDMDDPFNKYTLEEKKQMSKKELFALYEESGKYFDNQCNRLNESAKPTFKTIEEFLEYHNAVPFDEAMDYLSKLFDNQRL